MTKRNHAYWIDKKKAKKVKVEDHLLPEGLANRQGIKQIPDYIVIHEVSLGLGKSPKSFDMTHYEDKIRQDGLNGSHVGYHYLVGDEKIYQFIPDNECAFHTGTDFNYHSIGIERLICEGVSYPEALHNQAKLAATLMVKWDIPITRVISHKGTKMLSNQPVKSCPSRLIAGQYGGFRIFYREIEKCLRDKDLFYELLVDKYKINENKSLKKA